jgi:hypothetical protein
LERFPKFRKCVHEGTEWKEGNSTLLSEKGYERDPDLNGRICEKMHFETVNTRLLFGSVEE